MAANELEFGLFALLASVFALFAILNMALAISLVSISKVRLSKAEVIGLWLKAALLMVGGVLSIWIVVELVLVLPAWSVAVICKV